MSNQDLEFANDAKSAIDSTSVPGAWSMLIFFALCIAAGVVWAAWAKVEQVTSGLGQVIPSQQTQLVENLEPGIVQSILVKPGDEVKKGQKLLTVDDTTALSSLGELRQKSRAFASELHRLKLQSERAQTYVMPSDLDETSRVFHADQQAIFLTENRQLEERVQILQSQLLQKQQMLREAEASIAKQIGSLELTEREFELTERLFKRRAIPELEFLRVQRLVVNLKGELEATRASKIRIEAEISEAEKRIEAENSQFVFTAQERISRVNAELSIVTESLKAAEDRVKRAEFTSPVEGIVNKVNVATIGEVIQSGATLVEIVPNDGRLQIEVRIRPEDIAFIRPGLPATIRLTAYDFTRFGTLSGVVERIGADTITDEQNETFYQVTVSTDPEKEIPEQIKIIPGMIASVDILTGERTILEYLLKPVLRIRDTAFRDPK